MSINQPSGGIISIQMITTSIIILTTQYLYLLVSYYIKLYIYQPHNILTLLAKDHTWHVDFTIIIVQYDHNNPILEERAMGMTASCIFVLQLWYM